MGEGEEEEEGSWDIVCRGRGGGGGGGSCVGEREEGEEGVMGYCVWVKGRRESRRKRDLYARISPSQQKSL